MAGPRRRAPDDAPAADKDLLVVGRVGKPHGLKGELKVVSLADSPFAFLELKRLYLRQGAGAQGKAAAKAPAVPGPARPVAVLSARVHADTAILALEGTGDRDQAEALRGLEILAARRDLPDYDPGDVYIKDILGSQVFTGESWEEAAPLGTLDGLFEAPAQEIWVIKTPGGREVLFPATPEFTRDLDVAGRRVLIAPPPGLIELYLGDPDAPSPEPKD
ncbi:MAG: 16S rRNA processing protein RimM [Desulfovibrionaceae bacterium]|nr:16S rRNA processing protein RimM [Desulfovibrionaceae bacterium]MBF0515058.1 16S rRNA processing protein RimM [Desulfovibrionaceae bacterium]